jgi:putative membrane protein
MKKRSSLVVLIFAPLLTMCSWPHGPMMGGWDRPGSYGCGYGFGGGMFMGILFLIILAVAIYFIVQYLRSKNVTGHAQETALDILKIRYAKGELTKEDFDRMKNELQ